MEESLNTTPKLSSLKLLTYSELVNNIDQSRENNKKSQYSFLNLKNLVENFKLDNSFVSKSYYQNIPEYAFNDPPKGPIPEHFECIHCEQEGPDDHLKTCIKPFESSLYLTDSGESKYKRPSGTSYRLIVKKRGQKKVVSTNVKNQRFSDNVEIFYKNENETSTIIKIGKNGAINVISANFTESRDLLKNLFKKINESDALNQENYGSDTFKIDKSMSYVYLILAQFNLYPRELVNLFINLEALNLNLWETPFVKQKKGVKTFFVTGRERYVVENYRYNSGNITSRSNKTTNPFIQFDLITEEYFKVGVLVYKKGAVQMRLSYLDKSFRDREAFALTPEILRPVYEFLKKMFQLIIENSSETNYPIIVNEVVPEKRGILNMVDGTQPKVCHNRPGYELRPVPYSFYGTCPMQGYYVRPDGKQRPDGKFEPCCYKIKKSGRDSQDYINRLYKDGYKEVQDPDLLSAVFIPGTKTVESRRFNGLNDLTQQQLLDFMESTGYIGKSTRFDKTSKPKTLEFEQFGYLTNRDQMDNCLMVSIPLSTLRVFLEFDETGKATFVNGLNATGKAGLKKIPELSMTFIDGFLDDSEEIFYPFDVPVFKGKTVLSPFIKRFEILSDCLDTINDNSKTLVVSTNFDDSVENLTGEKNNFIIFIKSNSVYTPGSINKNVKINSTFDNIFISLNVHEYRANRWKVDINGKNINEILLPQRESSVEIPVVFTNRNRIVSGDIVLFKINTNTNGIINNNKPLIPVEKIAQHINDHTDLINILEAIKNPLKL